MFKLTGGLRWFGVVKLKVVESDGYYIMHFIQKCTINWWQYFYISCRWTPQCEIYVIILVSWHSPLNTSSSSYIKIWGISTFRMLLMMPTEWNLVQTRYDKSMQMWNILFPTVPGFLIHSSATLIQCRYSMI